MILWILLISPVFSQDITHNISAREAVEISRLLPKSVADSIRIELFLKLAEYHILKAGEYKPDLDSAGKFISAAERQNLRLASPKYEGYIFLVKAIFFRESGKLSEGKSTVKKAIILLRSTGDHHHLGLAYFELAQHCDYSDPIQLPEKIRLTELGSLAFRQSAKTELLAFSFKTLADLYNYNGETFKALENIKLSLKTYQSIHYRKLQAVYDLFGSIYYDRADLMQALNYELVALETAQNVNDTTLQLCEIYNNIGRVYTKLNDHGRALMHFKKAFSIAEKYHDNDNAILLMYNTVNSYIALRQPADALKFVKNIPVKYLHTNNMSMYYCVPMAYLIIYTSLKEFKLSRHYSLQLLHILRTGRLGVQSLGNIYLSLTRYYIASEQFPAALYYLQKNDSLLHQVRDPSALSRNYDLWVKLDTVRGDYRAAVKHLLLNKKLNDSISNDNNKRELKQITAFYQNEQKEDAIKLLQSQGKLQQAKIRQTEATRNWTIILAIILIMLLLAGIDRYRVKLRINKLVAAQQVKVNQNLTVENIDLTAQKDILQNQKEWLLSEIHHRVRNNLHTVISLLESQAAFLRNDALKAIEKSQHRIYAMSLIHQKIYNDDHLRAVDISGFIPELLRYLTDSYNNRSRITFQLEIADVKVSVTQAISLALIINEVVTNALSHAFRRRNTGKIRIRMNQVADIVTLVIADDGIGFDQVKGMAIDSLGLRLINGLSGDINAQIQIESFTGTSVSLTFPADTEAALSRPLIPERNIM
ncbi:histidine kinase dimerization/phosphoacceptor domain -containing protein [Mucilaginibacter aquariorum]|uniref:histidine kinase n=1 Tax=Mucilaginibacter aquariorum TaxID=2967225 RepID=A0ABT1SXR7_9SPHI|nr:histidine kinase dimerization/phosphoacceptor domain -containing protein [Mucilaginibacter aquariorum]MCQ6957013.1 ATP-binding protein [Mucilaginibacter aquariorum]